MKTKETWLPKSSSATTHKEGTSGDAQAQSPSHAATSTFQADYNAHIPRIQDATVTYIRKEEIPSRMYAKPQYKEQTRYTQ